MFGDCLVHLVLNGAYCRAGTAMDALEAGVGSAEYGACRMFHGQGPLDDSCPLRTAVGEGADAIPSSNEAIVRDRFGQKRQHKLKGGV